MSSSDVSVVVVHGAWADGSSWSKIIRPLTADGIAVSAAPLPLTSLQDDVAALDRALERAPGPAVLAGHAYADAVIAATRCDKVKGLVYIAALAPDEGQTVADVFYRGEPHPQAPKLAPDRHGLTICPTRLRRRLRAERCRRRSGSAGSRPAADLGRLHHRRRAAAPVEGPPCLVPGGRTGPDDRPGQSAFHGRAHAGPGALACRRSHADRDRPGRRPGRAP
jgi:hypothetical protein